MRLLILGGTRFLGRHIVAAARARGHDVTIFTRGRHVAELPAGVERLVGDRDGGLHALAGRTWDAVIDTSGHLPHTVEAAAELLADAVEHYTFVSTLAVYKGFPRIPRLDEDAPLRGGTHGTDVQVTPATIGGLKVACEQALEPAMRGRTLVVRAGLLVGPCDPTDRFAYWVRRVAQGGDVLAPGDPRMPVQLVDARDLADWILTSVAGRRTGAYNATGPAGPLTIRELLHTVRTAAGSAARFVWVDDRFLLEAGVTPMGQLPLWMPGAHGAATVDCRRAIAAGLRFRALATTVRDVLAWNAASAAVPPHRTGMAPGREAQLLHAWREVCDRSSRVDLARAESNVGEGAAKASFYSDGTPR